jgi:hypothetical protein
VVTQVARALLPFRGEMPSLPIRTTMLELVTWLSRYTDDDREVVARVTRLVNGGYVVLCGNFAGRKIS